MSTKLPQKPYLDPASTTILVTGASGYIGANIVQEALDLGYKVRGTVRTEEKAANSRKTHGNNPNYSTAIVSDFHQPSKEIDGAIKGVNSVIHVASDTTFNDDPEEVIGGVVRGIEATLEAATACFPIPNKKFSVDTKSWNDEAVDHAYKKRGQEMNGMSYPFVVYGASKTAGERAFWKFGKEKSPSFQQVAVLPNANIGRLLSSGGATGSMIPDLYKDAKALFLPPQWHIDVVDDARLHVIAAVLDEGVVGERIFAFAEPFNGHDAVEAVIKHRPESEKKIGHLREPDQARDLSTIPNELGAELLKKWYRQNGYTTFEESVKRNLEGL